MTLDEAIAGIDALVAIAPNPDVKARLEIARLEIAREYFANPQFREALRQHVWDLLQEPGEGPAR